MGHSTTPAYAIEFLTDHGSWTPAAWDAKHAGRPTAANLAKHVGVMEASTNAGGCNAHLGATKILAARILKNRGHRDLVAAYAAEHSSRLISWVVKGVPDDQEDVDIAYGDFPC